MKKWNKKLFLITSLIIFLPMIAGFLMYNRLPDRLITHWNAAGEPDGTMGKFAAIAVIPIFIFVMHLFCLFMTHLDPKTDSQSKKALLVAYWAMPVTGLFSGGMLLGSAMIKTLQVTNYLNLFFGVVFMLAGNYLPKCKQNSVLGIRLPWTLADEENWRKTHRLGGYAFIIGGVILLLSSFLPAKFQMPALLIIMTVVITVVSCYSYRLHKEKQRP